MHDRRTTAVVLAGALLAAATGGTRAAASPWPAPQPNTVEPDVVSAFVPVEPCRAVDTRGSARLAARTELLVDLAACTPPAGTLAAVLTVTAVDPAAPGYATAFPAGAGRPTASLLNWPGPGSIVANTGIIQTRDKPSGPAVEVYVHTATDLVVDVNGFFVRQPDRVAASGRFVPLALPERLLDTRLTARPAAGSTTRVPLPAGAVPADATAVLVNLTATESVGPSYVTAWAAGERPLASVLNLDRAGQTRAATITVGVSDGAFELFTRGGDQLIVDLIGYFTGATAPITDEGLFVPLAPHRQLDTRTAGEPVYASGTVEADDVVGGVFVGNVTITESTRPGYLRVLPARLGSSEASSVNADGRGTTAANLVVSRVSSAGLAVWSKNQADVVLDQTGYFTGPRPAATYPPSLNLPPFEPHYSTDSCTAWDPRLDYNRQPGAPTPREVRRVGTSVQGRPIWAEYYGPYNTESTVLVVGGVHGDECGPALVVDAARRTGGASTTVGYWIIPVLNPDGIAANNRFNAAGIDLNRDGFRSTQPESQALLAFTAEVRPDLTLHVHSPYGFVGGFGSDPRAYDMAAGIAWMTGMTRAVTAGDNPGDEFLWEGQMLIHPHAALLVELFPVRWYEGTVDRPRIPPRSVAEVAEDAAQTMAVIHQQMASP